MFAQNLMTSLVTRLRLSNCPLPWGWYGEVLVLSVYNSLLTSNMSSLPKFFPWSVWSTSGTPYRKTQLFTISFATSGASSPFSGRLIQYFVNIPTITSMCFARVSLAIVTGPKLSAATVCNRIRILNSTNSPILFLPAVVLAAHGRQQASFFSTSCLMCGHKKRWRILLNVFSTAKRTHWLRMRATDPEFPTGLLLKLWFEGLGVFAHAIAGRECLSSQWVCST